MTKRVANVLSFPQPEGDLRRLQTEFRSLLAGKDRLADTLLAAVIAGGHVLLEDVPGIGKTTTLKALARLLGLEMKRIQCTNDLLPADILGVEVFNPESQNFEFHRGPVFAEVVFADELNRASPRTQSALLEAMGEGIVTVNRKTYALPSPFLFFAAQNPTDHLGTFSLPESQLDRFAVKLSLDYPTESQELEIFRASARDPLARLPEKIVDVRQIQAWQTDVEKIHVAERLVKYVKRVVDRSRVSSEIRTGISTRGGLLWLRLARAGAILQGRDYVTPEDLLLLAPSVLAHRVVPCAGLSAVSVIENLLSQVEID